MITAPSMSRTRHQPGPPAAAALAGWCARAKSAIVILLASTAMLAAAPTLANEAALRAEVTMLKAQLAAQAARLERLEAKSDGLAQAQDRTAKAVAALPIAAPTAAAAAPVELARAESGTTIGGYGELNFNGYLKNSSRNLADVRRIVLSVGHKFNDKFSLVTELEVEHAIASAGDRGEVAIEQAYLNYRFNAAANVRAGLFLLPFGFINRNHEPPQFYGVARNAVETLIIPSTLREGGFSLYGDLGSGLAYDIGITTGYDVSKFDGAGEPLASIHQELTLARAASLSAYASLEYKGIPGLTIGGAVSSGNSVHSNAAFRNDGATPDLDGIKARVTLFDVHARYQIAGFDVKALYARGSIAQADLLTKAFAAANAIDGGTRPVMPSAFYGYLIEGAYTFDLGGDVALSPFARYERYNTQAKLPLGATSDPENRDKILTAGISFRPHPQIVLKTDYQKFFENSANDRINLGVGYMF